MFDVVILAAGKGSRAGLGYNKVLYQINNETILEKSIKIFSSLNNINNIIVVINQDDDKLITELLKNDKVKIVYGSTERYLSVSNGLNYVKSDYVLIHDAARCNVKKQYIEELMKIVTKDDAAFLGVKTKDTIHIIEDNNIMTPDRNNTYLAQTPQGFKSNLIKKAYQLLLNTNDTKVTDDVMVLKKYLNINSKVVLSSYDNIKYTTPEDFQ